eukprot:CAMPEP_0178428552 /NCGR_PEP_ID=MMETSP0689_2-20121128/30339_1 /TAXON_ID=160604 /ORGANISM="Amphidinium massartii, Strain CS-259" /LENGTH=470 /DNA_ID=CAMNT_0020050333 /DNA_START=1 /DNA_END=1410 /DNA_ORIENTATION=+
MMLLLLSAVFSVASGLRGELTLTEVGQNLEEAFELRDWKVLGKGMTCKSSERKRLPYATSLQTCGYYALLDPECESEPHQIYVKSGKEEHKGSLKCRCVLKGKSCSDAWTSGYTIYEYVQPATPPKISEYPLNILATRHGLSCANVAQKWLSGFQSLKHIRMDDPVLTGAGIANSQKASEEIKSWLQHHNLEVDATVSSVLVRAMQTAAYEYPTNRTLYVVPYIREKGFGSDNVALSFEKQMRKVDWSGLPSVNTHFADKFGRDAGGEWDAFKDFLASDFLPHLFPHGPEEAQLTLAVVTHSNFMNSGEISSRCKSLYPEQSNGKVKAWNNQAVSLPYKLRVLMPPGSSNPFYLLVDSEGECTAVAAGMPIPTNPQTGDAWELCREDVGESCEKQLKAEAKLPKFREDIIAGFNSALQDISERVEAFNMELEGHLVKKPDEEREAELRKSLSKLHAKLQELTAKRESYSS